MGLFDIPFAWWEQIIVFREHKDEMAKSQGIREMVGRIVNCLKNIINGRIRIERVVTAVWELIRVDTVHETKDGESKDGTGKCVSGSAFEGYAWNMCDYNAQWW